MAVPPRQLSFGTALLSDMASSTTRQASVVNSALCQMILSLRNGVGFRGS